MENLGLDAKLFALYGKFDIEEIANHLLMNGYKTKVDKKCGVLTVPEEEYYEVKTILSDRRVHWTENVAAEFELTKDYTLDENGDIASEDTFIVPADWLRNYYEKYKDILPTKSDNIDEFLDIYDPKQDGQMMFDAACFDGVIRIDGMTGI